MKCRFPVAHLLSWSSHADVGTCKLSTVNTPGASEDTEQESATGTATTTGTKSEAADEEPKRMTDFPTTLGADVDVVDFNDLRVDSLDNHRWFHENYISQYKPVVIRNVLSVEDRATLLESLNLEATTKELPASDVPETRKAALKAWRIDAEAQKSEIRGGRAANMSFLQFTKKFQSEDLYAIVPIETDAVKNLGAQQMLKLATAASEGQHNKNDPSRGLTNHRPPQPPPPDAMKKPQADHEVVNSLRAKLRSLVRIPEFVACKETLFQSLTFWISSGGTSSVLHQDDADNFLMQFAGRKEAVLIDPVYAREFLYASGGVSGIHQDDVRLGRRTTSLGGKDENAQHWKVNTEAEQAKRRKLDAARGKMMAQKFATVPKSRVRLNAGDILYIPYGYWHQVNSYSGERPDEEEEEENQDLFPLNLAANVWWSRAEDYKWVPDSLDAFPNIGKLRRAGSQAGGCEFEVESRGKRSRKRTKNADVIAEAIKAATDYTCEEKRKASSSALEGLEANDGGQGGRSTASTSTCTGISSSPSAPATFNQVFFFDEGALKTLLELLKRRYLKRQNYNMVDIYDEEENDTSAAEKGAEL